MQITTKAIVLSSIKYGESSLIVKAYTEKEGLQSYLLKGVLSSRKSKIKAAYFQPLTQLEIVASHKAKGSLEHIREVQVSYHYQSIYSDMAKNAIAIFLAEVLLKSIGEGEDDSGLFEFLEASFQWLDTHDQISNFHLYFMIRLSKFLGFFPDISYSDAIYFDLQAGQFVDKPGLNPTLQGTILFHFKRLLGTKFDAIHKVKMAKTERQDLLQNLVMYFELHLHGFQKPRSLAILNEVFN